jgi:hypothetical protein
MDDKARDFCRRYNARLETSQYRLSKIKKDGVRFSPEEVIADPALDIEYEQMVSIHLPQAQARALVEHDEWIHTHIGKSLGDIIKEHEQECRARNENPAVKAAYEKYLTLLNLVGSAYDYDS